MKYLIITEQYGWASIKCEYHVEADSKEEAMSKIGNDEFDETVEFLNEGVESFESTKPIEIVCVHEEK